jgi:MGT family glycosyltransferase
MSSRKVDALIVDQLDLATGTVAELLGIPFVNICIQPPLYLDDEVSPFIFDWKPSSSPPERSRNRARNNLVRALLSPVLDTVQKQRRLWGLWLKSDLNEFFSDRAMITQLPAILEFERAHNPRIFYTGPFTDDAGRRPVRFPWELVGKKPIVYACMGTVRNHAVHIFRAIATACADINAQLIMSLGGASTLPSDIGFVPENCIVAHYVPQLEILLRAALSITHAGTNTVLESLSRAVPMIALPVTDDQPGMAARIRWKRLGTVVPFRRVSVPRLRDSIRAVLADPLVHANVRQIQPSIQAQTSVGRAVDIIESKLP